MSAQSAAMAEVRSSDSELRQSVTDALASRWAVHEWPISLRRVWDTDRETAQAAQIAFVLKLGFALTLVTTLTDVLIAPAIVPLILAIRLTTIAPLVVLGLLAARKGHLGRARIATVAAMMIFAATAMWIAVGGSDADMARYSMAIAITMMIGMLVLPMSLPQKMLSGLAFFLASFAAALYPAPIPFDVLVHHTAAAMIAAIVGYILSMRGQRHEARAFLLGLQQRFNREDLERSNALLRELSERDPLTGLPNRRSFERAFEQLSSNIDAERIALMMIDIDHFKRFNDRYGHQAGDRCLIEVGRVLDRAFTGCPGHVARFGGEEFVALLVEEEGVDARSTAEALKFAFSRLAIPVGLGKNCAVTASIGVAYSGEDQTLGGLIGRADKALYRAKRNGRNRVETTNTPHPMLAA